MVSLLQEAQTRTLVAVSKRRSRIRPCCWTPQGLCSTCWWTRTNGDSTWPLRQRTATWLVRDRRGNTMGTSPPMRRQAQCWVLDAPSERVAVDRSQADVGSVAGCPPISSEIGLEDVLQGFSWRADVLCCFPRGWPDRRANLSRERTMTEPAKRYAGRFVRASTGLDGSGPTPMPGTRRFKQVETCGVLGEGDGALGISTRL